MMTRSLLCAVAAAIATAALPAEVAAQPDGGTHLLVITALSGEPRFGAQYRAWGATLMDAATSQWGVPAAHAVWLAEREDVHGRVKARSTRENVEAEIRTIVERAAPTDRVVILIFGHGSFAGGETRVNLPGPDITGRELSALLAPLATQRVAIVNAASASGGYIQELAAPNRVVITATRTGFEQNETIFGGHFVAALTDVRAADTDNDGRVSLLEAFEYARREVERAYRADNKLQTEHAVIDAIGSGTGVRALEEASPHTQAAASFHIGARAGAAAGRAQSPELRALYAEKERIEGELATLRANRAGMPEPQYEARLEELLVALTLNGQAIRRLEGGS